MRLLWMVLTVAVLDLGIKLVDAEEKEEKGATEKPGEEKADNKADEVGKFFKSFFDPGAGEKAFKKFIKEGKKILKKGGFAPPPGTGGDDDDSDEKEAKDGEGKDAKPKKTVPIPAKVFIFYAKSYGCQKSKIYKKFLADFKKGTTGGPEEEPEAKEKSWLNEIAETAVAEETEEDSAVTVSQAQQKLSGLDADQKAVLNGGEKEMPLAAAAFVNFIKAVGCENVNAPKYDKFKELFTAEAVKAKEKKKKYTNDYYVAKATTIAEEL